MKTKPKRIKMNIVNNTKKGTRANRKRLTAQSLLRAIVYFIIVFIFTFPFLWMVLSSFKSSGEIFRYAFPLSWKTIFPPNPTFENFVAVFSEHKFGVNLANSIFVSLAQVLGSLLVCSFAAFALSRIKFRGRNAVMLLILITAMVPFEVILIPLFIVIRDLGIINSYLALILPAISSPFSVFLLRQSFADLPKDFDEAAVVEGANLFQIYWHIILPNSKSSLITVALLGFMNSWNSFLWPLIVLQDPKKQMIQVALASFTNPSELPAWGEIFAAATIATVPVLILFITLQKYYIQGFVLSGIKG